MGEAGAVDAASVVRGPDGPHDGCSSRALPDLVVWCLARAMPVEVVAGGELDCQVAPVRHVSAAASVPWLCGSDRTARSELSPPDCLRRLKREQVFATVADGSGPNFSDAPLDVLLCRPSIGVGLDLGE